MIKIINYSSIKFLKKEIKNIGVDPIAINILANKGNYFGLKIEKVPPVTANILKQEMLSVGGDAAVAKNTINCKIEYTDVLLIGNTTQYLNFVRNIESQPFKIKNIAKEISQILNQHTNKQIKLNNGKILSWDKKPLIMGILNTTPDSFSDGGKYNTLDTAISRVENMINDGADIIDIGGESSRPGSDSISEIEEMNRVIPILKEIRKHYDIPISIDTYKSNIAQRALDEGANIINDISAGKFDNQMIQIIKKYDVPYIIMHMLGTPKNMQLNPHYTDAIKEIYDFLNKRVLFLLEHNIKPEKIIIDPGIGFGKRLIDNLQILKHLSQFNQLGFPVLLGASRKSFIKNIDNSTVNNRLGGSLAAVAAAIKHNIAIVRVHDVLETRQFIEINYRIEQGE